MTKIIVKLVNYIKASTEELKKVAWPTRAETTKYSVLVIAISLAVAAAIGVFDYVLTLGFEALVDIKK